MFVFRCLSPQRPFAQVYVYLPCADATEPLLNVIKWFWAAALWTYCTPFTVNVQVWMPTSSLLPFCVNLKPGMRLGLHATPTSSECLQSDTPKPLDWHWARLFSAPVQCTLSNQIWPGTTRTKVGKWMQMDFLLLLNLKLLSILVYV